MASLADFLMPASNPNDPNAILGPNEIARRQALADQLGGDASDYSHIGSITQGLARLTGGLVSGYQTHKNDEMLAQGRKNLTDKTTGIGPMLANLLNGGASQPSASQPSAPQGTAQPASYNSGNSDGGGNILDKARNSIYGMESSHNYKAVGPVTANGDRAYGAGQVMGKNIPDWTAKALGRRLTTEQYLADPQAQDAVFNAQFGGYLKNHSPQDAASMWFTGRPQSQGGGAQDVLGTTGNQYVSKFTAGLGGQPSAPQTPQGQTPQTMPPPPNSGVPSVQNASYVAPAGVDMTHAQPIPAATAPQQAAQPQAVASATQAPPQGTAQPASFNSDANSGNSDNSLLMQKLQAIITDPYATPQVQQVYGSIFEHLMSQSDPANRIALQSAQIDLENKQHPENVKLTPDKQATVDWYKSKAATAGVPNTQVINANGHQQLINSDTGEVIKDLGTSVSVPGGYEDTKNQQKLEQEYRAVREKELSSRSGGLGLQDAKVNQAVHLRALIDQYKQDDGKGNVTYNIPTSQYHELAIGLANLVSPGGQTSDTDRQAINAHTAAGDFNGAIQYITGVPQNGNTQEMTKNIIDSIDRQGSVAEEERETYLKRMTEMAPTDLDPKRRDAITGSGLTSFKNRPGATTSAKPIAQTAPAQNADALAQAKNAIASGAPRDKVIQRLKENGIDASGL